VDDEEDIRESLRTLLEMNLDGVDVHAAASGPEALALLGTTPVDVLISDYKMPGMNGLELLAKIGRTHPHLPRILVTAFPDLDIAIRAINEAGIENFFTKPFDPDQVLNVVRALLFEQRAQDMRNRSFARSLDMLRRNLERG
jgi:two-component system response regulator AtoC